MQPQDFINGFAVRDGVPYDFGGIISARRVGQLTGVIRDHFGESSLSEIYIHRDVVRFRRTYPGSEIGVFDYEMYRPGDDGPYIGEYSGRGGLGQIISGRASCEISPIPPQMYEFLMLQS